jgi:hypothetical protein
MFEAMVEELGYEFPEYDDESLQYLARKLLRELARRMIIDNPVSVDDAKDHLDRHIGKHGRNF